jgi:hypothetical protein
MPPVPARRRSRGPGSPRECPIRTPCIRGLRAAPGRRSVGISFPAAALGEGAVGGVASLSPQWLVVDCCERRFRQIGEGRSGGCGVRRAVGVADQVAGQCDGPRTGFSDSTSREASLSSGPRAAWTAWRLSGGTGGLRSSGGSHASATSRRTPVASPRRCDGRVSWCARSARRASVVGLPPSASCRSSSVCRNHACIHVDAGVLGRACRPATRPR